VAVGAVALLVPVVPTTPFLLIAAACFAKSSPRFYHWLINHRLFGPFIRNYREKGGITRRQKVIALATFLPAVFISGFFFDVGLWSRIILAVCGVGVTTYLLLMKTVKE
jgi:uncharacterized membrane protein YbaN (DUF454 family)